MKALKRTMSIFLIVAMMVGTLGVTGFASESVEQNEVQKTESEERQKFQSDVKENELETTDEGNNLPEETTEIMPADAEQKQSASSVLEYVYLDEETIRTPQEQNIVVSFKDTALELASIKLYYQNIAGEELSTESIAVAGNTALFTLKYEETSSEDIYTLVRVEYMSTMAEKQMVIFADENINLSYQVTTVLEQGADISAYALGENGEVEINSGDSITDVVQTALPKEVQTTKSLARSAKGGELVVAVTAGHGGNDSGAVGYGLREADLTGKVATYFIQELSRYNGVRIVEVPRTYSGTNNVMSIYDRVQYAVSNGANVYLDLHFNAGGGTGAEIYYPGAASNPGVNQEGKNLAELMLQQLAALGLANRGAKIRTYIDDQNGTQQDYYGTVRYCKQNGIPGIVVEHAFMDNPNDINKLRDEAFLKSLGMADATGVAKKYNLSKGPVFNASMSASAKLSADQKTSEITTIIKNANQGVASVSVAVWGDVDGQNDIRWYPATQSSAGEWKINANINNHKESGTYFVHSYLTTASGEVVFAGATSFMITPPTMKVSMKEYNADSGTIEIRATSIMSPSGVQRIQFPVWKEGDQVATIHWYEGVKQSDGSYKAIIDVKNHKFSIGRYIAHGYITAGNGIVVSVDGGVSLVTTLKTDIQMIDISGNETQYRIKANNLNMFGAAKFEAAVWGADGGQNDLIWYNIQKDTKGAWTADVDIKKHRESGAYNVHLYAQTLNGIRVFVGMTSFSITRPLMKVSMGNYNAATGTMEIKATEFKSPSGVERVQFPVWKDGVQSSTIHWYEGTKQADGSYKAIINVQNHNYATGTYLAHGYITGKNGVVSSVDGGAKAVAAGKIDIGVSDISGQETKYRISTSNVGYLGASECQVAVWGTNEGQNDLIWYTARKGASGLWVVDVNIENHKEFGEYAIHVYAKTLKGTMVFAGMSSFSVTRPLMKVSMGSYNAATGTMEIKATEFKSPSGVERVQFPVWKDGVQSSTIHWYEGTKQADGSYKAIVNVQNHSYSMGTYLAHGYITGKNGVVSSVDGGTRTVTAGKVSIEASDISGNEMKYRIKSANIGLLGTMGCQVAVWGKNGGQNDLIWYTAKKDTAGSWIVDVDINNHKESGTYYVHVYAKTATGGLVFAGLTEFKITHPSMKVSIGEYDAKTGTIPIKATDFVSPSGVRRVQFPVWNGGDQAGTIYWYEGTKQTDGSYIATINVRNHGYSTGIYLAHGYITGNNDVIASLDGGRVLVNQVTATDLYSIMGQSSVTAKQMENLFNAYRGTYPGELAQGGASSIGEFCQIAYEEAKAENVKPEVLFAQMMHETGFLKFTGDVKPNQFNFGGLGATGGVPGNSFPNVRTGIRAQVQHLKCYASNEPLRQPLVDPRWGNWLRNKAPYVEWLAIPKNPYGTGWAADANYGTKLLLYIDKIKAL